MSQWVKIDYCYFNTDHIVAFLRKDCRLLIWDDSTPVEGVTQNVSIFVDPDGEKYRSLCQQLCLNTIASGLPKLNNQKIRDCRNCRYAGTPTYKSPCSECEKTDYYSKWEGK